MALSNEVKANMFLHTTGRKMENVKDKIMDCSMGKILCQHFGEASGSSLIPRQD